MKLMVWMFACALGEAAGFCSVSLLNEAVETLEKSLNFMKEEVRNINLDGALGCRLADDQLSYLLESLPLEFKTSFAQLSKKLQNLQRLAAEISDTAIDYIRESQPGYFQSMGPLLESGMWHLRYPSRTVRSSLWTKPLKCSEIPFSEQISDQCISELIGTNPGGNERCNISEKCWKVETTYGFKGYTLTHQVLYFQVAETVGCLRQMSDELVTEVANLQDYFCANVFRDAELIAKHGFLDSEQDLFMEQIGLCGMLGYKDFFQIPWLKKIISWQLPRGCFTRKVDKHSFCKDEDKAENVRHKREERKLEGGCLSHKTTVAIIALTANVRFCIESMDLQQ